VVIGLWPPLAYCAIFSIIFSDDVDLHICTCMHVYSYQSLIVPIRILAAVEARIRIGWNKFRQLVPLLINKDVSLMMREGCTVAVCVPACCMEVRPSL